MRCNTGINVKYLADSHLIAEQVELLMVPGMLRRNHYTHKTPIPPTFRLGTGHITFWFDKLIYLQRRMNEVKREVSRRGFKVMDRNIDLNEFPQKYINDWQPTLEDSKIVRARIVEKLNRKPFKFWRYESNYIKDIQEFGNKLLNSDLFYV